MTRARKRVRRYKIFEGGTVPHFVTWTLTEWAPLFISDAYCRIILDSLDYCRREKGLLVHGYVVMPTHVHGILSVSAGGDLSSVLRDSRKFTAKAIIYRLHEDGNKLFAWVFRNAAQKDARPGVSHKVWIEGVHPETLESEKFVIQKLEYLHQNPVRKGLVAAPEHWWYSSAATYLCGGSGPLEVDAFIW